MSDPNRYQLERTQTESSELMQVQDSLGRVFEQLSTDTLATSASADTARTSGGTAYTPTTAADWATSGTPSTVQEALDRIAATLGPI